MKSVKLDTGLEGYTDMNDVFSAIDNAQVNYNWLITSHEFVSYDKFVQEFFDKEYVWLTGKELTSILKDGHQFIWGVISGFKKDVALERILEYDLPSCDCDSYWSDKVTIQHPLADVEIYAFDSSYTVFISKNDMLVEKFCKAYPQAKDLEAKNRKKNAQIAHIEKLLIVELNRISKVIDDKMLNKKYEIWRKLYYKKDKPVNNQDIINCIKKCLLQ